MAAHVIKLEYDNGKKLNIPTLWCGNDNNGMSFCFMDAQHVALAAGGSIAPCQNCVKAIIKELQREL